MIIVFAAPQASQNDTTTRLILILSAKVSPNHLQLDDPAAAEFIKSNNNKDDEIKRQQQQVYPF